MLERVSRSVCVCVCVCVCVLRPLRCDGSVCAGACVEERVWRTACVCVCVCVCVC